MNKYILITGSTDGIGFDAAKVLAQHGHNLYIHGRSQNKLDKARDVLLKLGAASVTCYLADFTDMHSVAQLAEQIMQDNKPLDVLVNNAGVFQAEHTGQYDIRFLVNYLAPYLLTNKLLPVLDKAQHPLVINLSSAAQAAVSRNALLGNKQITANQAYAQSKLALTMWTRYLAILHDNLTVIAVNPGSLLNTKMVHEAYNQVWSEVSKGSSLIVDLIEDPIYLEHSGEYFDNDLGDARGDFNDPHQDAFDGNKIKALIETTDQILANYL